MPYKAPRNFAKPNKQGFIRSLSIAEDRIGGWDAYPYNIPAIRQLGRLNLHPRVTYFIGENGSGKSTLIEAIAVGAGLNAEGGSKAFHFATKRTDSGLSDALQMARGIRRERDGFFLRGETLYNVATEIDDLADPDKDGSPGIYASYGGGSLHNYSHGESFIALFKNRFRDNGLYILDEPESALSITRQFALLRLMDEHVQTLGSQFILATHSPILLAYPDSIIYQLDETGIQQVRYEDAESYKSTRDFLNNAEKYLQELCPHCPQRGLF